MFKKAKQCLLRMVMVIAFLFIYLQVLPALVLKLFGF